MTLPTPSFAHLIRLSDDTGLLEDARLLTPRRKHGYTTDDVARGLIAICREPAPGPALTRLAEVYLAFLEDARRPDGTYHNRLGIDRRWADEMGSADCHGRALMALGTAARSAPEPWLRLAAASAFAASAPPPGAWPRPHATAVLGAVEILAAGHYEAPALALLERSAAGLPGMGGEPWPWPEPRLTYENARIPEALLAAGVALADRDLMTAGLGLLEWLAATETREGHFSFAPAGGWGPGDPRPGFDQQPVEAEAMADACARAWAVTGERRWADRVMTAATWFLGDNDAGVPLYDPASGACCDGLKADGANPNAGAESTLAAILTLQQARQVALLSQVVPGGGPVR